MAVLEFKTVLEEDGVIRVPGEVIKQLTAGEEIYVSIKPAKPVSAMTPDEAWQALLAGIEQRVEMAKHLPPAEPYQWRREDAYEHLDERYGPEGPD
jgi:hypothetical protein